MTRTTTKKPLVALEPGDRVRAYDCCDVIEGEFVGYGMDGLCRIAVPREEPNCSYKSRHPKQCRRLRPKPPKALREWWLACYIDRMPLAYPSEVEAMVGNEFCANFRGVVHVREVLHAPKGKEPARDDQ